MMQPRLRTLRHSLRWLLCVAAIANVAPAVAFAAESPTLPDFHVGNSLTIDAEVRPNEGGMDGILQSVGVTRPAAGWQVASGTPLHRHFTFTDNNGDPIKAGVSDAFGRWDEAFAKHAFHAVTLQPFSIGSTATQERDALIGLIQAVRANPANAETKLYLYPAWPATPDRAYPVTGSTTFREVWEAPLPTTMDGNTPWPRTAAGTAWIGDAARGASGADLTVVPIGEVLAELDARLREQPVAGFDSVWSLYRDPLHLGPRPGRDGVYAGIYVATLTMAATLYDIDPTDTNLPKRFQNRVDPAFAELAQQVVAEVIHTR